MNLKKPLALSNPPERMGVPSTLPFLAMLAMNTQVAKLKHCDQAELYSSSGQPCRTVVSGEML